MKDVSQEQVRRFVLEQIESVPHLEAILLLWNSRPKCWDFGTLAERLFVSPDTARSILADLVRRNLVVERLDEDGIYSYLSSAANDYLMEVVDRAYRTDLIGITTAIHSKASTGIREFARAFEFGRKGKKP